MGRRVPFAAVAEGVLMTVHCVRDLIVGSTASYGNFYAVGCFMVGVLGFTQVGASGHSIFKNNLLPTPIASGSFTGSILFGSGTTATLQIPLSAMTVLPDDEVGGVFGIAGLSTRTKPEYLNVLSAAFYQSIRPSMTASAVANFYFAYTGSVLPPGLPSWVTGSVTMNVPPEWIDTDPNPSGSQLVSLTEVATVYQPDAPPYTTDVTTDSVMWSGSVGSGVIANFPSPPVPPCILAIKSANFPLANSGLFTITSIGYSAGYSAATGSVTGTYNITFDYRASSPVMYETGSIQWTLFPPVEWVLNDYDPPFNYDPDADGDLDISGYDNNPFASVHQAGATNLIQGTPACDSPQVGTTGPPNFFPVYSFTNDTSPSPSDIDYSGGGYDKAFWWNVWVGFSDGSNPSNPGTFVVNLLDLNPPGNNYDVAISGGDGRYHINNMLRAIYQSPHPSGWQVRLCLENQYVRQLGQSATAGVCFTIAPGVNAPTGSGDFLPGLSGGQHLHGPAWFNSVSGNLAGSMVGLDPNINTAGNHGNLNQPSLHGNPVLDYAVRFYAWGDDQTGSVFFLNRALTNSSDGMCLFGLPEDETLPLPPLTVQRLFVVGSCTNNGNDVHWHCGTQQNEGTAGVAYSLLPYLGPISCVMSSYTLLAAGNANTNYIINDPSAGATPFLSGNELIPVDLIAGAQDNNYWDTSVAVMSMEPRRLGRVPIGRQGPATGMTNWTTGSNGAWFHAKNGMYFPWGGVTPLP